MQDFQDIFISYGRRDSLEFASRLNRQLIDRGFTVWFDYDDIPLGVDYQKQIDDGIERADNVLFIISPHSINSPYCGLELELALKRHKRIIPLLHVERISYETWKERNPGGTEQEWDEYQAKGLHDHFQNMHPILRKINWIYAREGQDNFEAALAGLLDICDRHKDYVHQHTLLLDKALEWERHQKRSPYLLIGEERLQAEDWLNVRFKDSQPPCLPTPLHCEFITESRKNAENLMTDVFFAYADEDRGAAGQIRNSLWREGFTVWMNTTDIQAGREFQQVIDSGIEEADNVVYLLSLDSVRSPYCQHELDYALSLNKRIIPLLAEAVPLEQIPLTLRNLHYIDLTDNVKDSDYEQDESQLLQVLRQDAAYHETHKVLVTKALKWKRQNHNPALLLRGYNLHEAEAWYKLARQHVTHPSISIQETFIEESRRQPPGLSLDVFISYSRADSGFARKLNNALQLQGKRTWFDQESIAVGTADFQQEIYQGIESADIFLFILSPRSVKSPYCADEVEYAAKLNKRFVTVLHQSIDSSTLHPELAKVQWLDFHQRGGDFSAHLTELLRILDTDTEHLRAHTRLLLRAIEWDEKGRKESLLLRDDELTNAEQWLSQCDGKNPQPTELQQAYVVNSRSVEDANHQAAQILKKAAEKGKRLVALGAIAGSVGFLFAIGSVWNAQQRINAITIESTLENAREQLANAPFAALLETLKAGQLLTQSDSHHRNEVVEILQESISTVRERNSLEGHQSSVYDIAFSPDGQILASVGNTDATIRLWNAETGELLYLLDGHEDWVSNISFSPDGQTLASASADNTIIVWDVETGEPLQTLRGHQEGVRGINFSPDGTILASGSQDNTIKLWDVATGDVLQTLEGHQDGIWRVSFSPDGQTLVSASQNYDSQLSTIKLWTVETGEEQHTLVGHQDFVSWLSFSPDGNLLASASADQTTILWDVATGQALRTLQGHDDEVFIIEFSPDGTTLASGGRDKTIRLWDVATGEEQRTLTGHQGEVWDLRFSPDGATLASASADSTIKLWDMETGEEVSTLRGHQGDVWVIPFSPDGSKIASGGFDTTIKLWDIAPRPELRPLQGHKDVVFSVTYSPDGQTLASGSFDNTIKIWDVATRRELQTLTGHNDVVLGVSFSPDGQTLASGSVDDTIKIWNLESGEVLQTLTGHDDDVISVNFSPDGQTLVSGSSDNTIKLWNIETGEVLQTLTGHDESVFSVSFSTDGQTLASGSSDRTIKLWDVKTGELLQTLSGHQSRVSTTRFSPDGQTLASSSADQMVKLWGVETGELLQTLQGHQGGVISVSFSPDGKTLASSGDDRTIKLWDVDTGELLQTLEGHQSSVLSVSFSPDGTTIASGSWDNTIRFWVWDFDRLMTMGCDWIQPYLVTRPEQQYLCEGYLPPQ
ncbi:TIR domain-containing protein [Leptolyngbya sp. CCY15150]|uniref:toll/interleukin-1 receptor domain-containing protein n=1 Tax=Leptolyngbya sp. CCY15150 TaxID=2767772 RepID=UPI00195283C4|nr:TIR domain-containing protein [Leptolyngbya sp. CCY15150]